MRKSVVSVFLVLFPAQWLLAQTPEFPYKARVVASEVYIRSGAGKAFYPTASLTRDAIVNVRRHDPGGWFMIDPPKESFSWIPTKYVRKTSGRGGEVVEDNIAVFVGSSFGDEVSVWQRSLMRGDKVEILGMRRVDMRSGPQDMYRIQPPAREYRWIPGSAVIPVSEKLRTQRDSDPYSVPSAIAERDRSAEQPEPSPASEQEPKNAGAFSPSPQLARLQKIREEQRRLAEIDQKFRSMILSDPANWDLKAIEAAYEKLQKSVTYKPIAGQIDLRYPAISRYRTRKAAIEEFRELTSATDRRDAELMAAQYGIPNLSAAADESDVTPENRSTGLAALPPLSSAVALGPVPSPAVATSDETPGGMSSLTIPSTHGYIGAGLVRRSSDAAGTGYLLTTPSGKVLAHLKADESVDLESYVGRPVGVRGSRWFNEQIRSDYIEVSELEEVRIRR